MAESKPVLRVGLLLTISTGYSIQTLVTKYGRFLENGSKKRLRNGSERIGTVKNSCRFLLGLSRSITVPFPRS